MMRKLFCKNNLIKTCLLIIIIAYVIITLLNQQKKLQSYANTKEYYAMRIAEEKQNKEKLVKTKENLNSDEYVERVAREKLDMYYPNEKVYIDVEQ